MPHDSALAPIGDTYIDIGFSYANRGTAEQLRFVSGDPRRSLIKFDTAQIRAVVGADSLTAAHLELTISSAPSGWGTGLLVDLHRMTHSWTELGATWDCSVDANTSNTSNDCSGATSWNMSGSERPYDTTAATSDTLHNNQTGVVSFDVTSEVRAVLTGTMHFGWLIKKRTDSDNAAVDFSSREGATAPRLVLSTLNSIDTTVPALPTAQFVMAYDTTKLVADSDSTLFQRDVFEVAFKPGVSGTAIRSFLTRYGATIIGGQQGTGAYMLRIRDPLTQTGFDSVSSAIRSESIVDVAGAVVYRFNGTIDDPSRWPRDGGGVQRSDWFAANPGSGTRGLLQAHFPLAWGCETGRYGSPPPDIAVLDWYFANHADLNVKSTLFPTTLQNAPTGLLGLLQSTAFQAHGMLVGVDPISWTGG